MVGVYRRCAKPLFTQTHRPSGKSSESPTGVRPDMHSDSRRLLADWPGAVIVAFALIASGCAGEPESPAKDSATAAFDASVFDAGARATDASSSETDAFDGAPSLDAASLDAAALDSGAADAAESPDIGGADGTASNESD